MIRRELQGRADDLVVRAIREIYDQLEAHKAELAKARAEAGKPQPAPIPMDNGLAVSVYAPVGITSGLGTPEGNVAGKIGDLYIRQDGGAGTSIYIKESGAGTRTGWVGK